MSQFYLPEGLPIPVPEPNGLSRPYWEGLRADKLVVQRNPRTQRYQWPAQWIAQDDHGFDLEWVEVRPAGVIYSWTRVWHPTHPALKGHGPYIVVVVELPELGVRMLGNLLGDPQQAVEIGAKVEGVFEHHNEASTPFTLLHWRLTDSPAA